MHSFACVRDKDIDDEYIKLIKAKPSFIVGANLPDRGVRVDRSWLRTLWLPLSFRKFRPTARMISKNSNFSESSAEI
jgi:hypothetical protein